MMTGFLLRWIAALALVMSTFNPTEYNFFRWATTSFDAQTSLVVLAGLVLFVGYVIYLRATLRSIGPFGVLIIIALLGALAWVFVDFGLLNFQDPDVMTWLGLVGLSLVLGVGLTWSHVRRALSGQADMDDLDD